MSPDPSHKSEHRRISTDGSTYVVGTINTAENDDDHISYEGYEVLPQNYNESHLEQEDVNDQESSSDTDDEEDAQGNSILTGVAPSTFDQSTKIELTELWNSTDASRITDITMDSTKEEEIKNAMAGFKLPSSSIPLWANNVPEEEWKQQILNRLSCLNKT